MAPAGMTCPVRPLKVLYLHHVGPFGGSSRSLLEMIKSFPAGAVMPRIATQRGQYAEILRDEQIPVISTMGISQFDNSRYSHYRGMRWLVLLRELAYLPFTAFILLRARRRWPDVDIVHVNEVSMIPSMLLARWLFRRPVVVHVRSVQRSGPFLRTRFVERLLGRYASLIVAIDNNVRRSLSGNLRVEVVHNGLRFPETSSSGVPQGMGDKNAERRPFTVAMVGTLSRVKGCIEFVRAAAICKRRGLDIRFVFVGKSARPPQGLKQALLRWLGLSQEIEDELNQLIEADGLHAMVEFRPFTKNLDDVYRSIDLLCFPSHYDAPGRPIFEAAFYGLPSIAAVTEPIEDTIVNGETGVTIRPRHEDELAAAIEHLYLHPDVRAEMGRKARALALGGFEATRNAMSMLKLYESLPTCKAGALG